jgi:ribosome biogenesis protein MAK21
MKGVVVHEISGFVLRGGAPTSLTSTHPPNPKHIRFTDNKKKTAPPTGKPAAPGSANAHLTYYALITLNQIVLSAAPADAVVARELATVYFEVFRVVLGIGAADGGSAQDEEAQGEEGGEEGGGERGSEGEADKSGGRGRNKKAKGKDRVKGKKAAAGDIPFAELEDSNSKIISAVLTGLHRALPFVGLENDDR